MKLFTTDHRTLGIRYLLLALLAVTIGTIFSLFMRIHLVWPYLKLPFWGIVPPEDYLALVTMHGTIMVFFVLTTAPINGLASLVLPSQIGARRMALPRLNALCFWLTSLSLAVLLAAFFVPDGAPISGWTNYPPLSAFAAAGPGQALGMDLWLVSIGIFCLASILGAISMLATILGKRCLGMTVMRMPLTVWSWLVASGLIVFAFSILFIAALLLLSDRHLGTTFFIPPGEVISGLLDRSHPHASGDPMLWLHLFWFFGHPEVYIAILPGMGLTSSLLANFTRRSVTGYRWMVYATLAIGIFGLMVWGHHMFVSGMNPYAGTAFALTTMAIALPSSAEVLTWLAMLIRGRASRVSPMPTPMLFTLGFLSFFIAGGLTGPILAQPILDAYLHNTYFVVAHFHLVMSMAGVFSLFAAVYYWFPLMTGRLMNEALGKWHFWLSLIGAYLTFFPMHFAGLAGEPRHYAQLTGSTSSLSSLLPLQTGITHSAFLLAAAQLLFLVNLAWSARRGKAAGDNPWKATTLEWASNPDSCSVQTGPYEYGFGENGTGFVKQCSTGAEQE